MNKKSIIIVVPSLKMGGMESYTKNIANKFVENNYIVYIYLLLNPSIEQNINSKITIISPISRFNSPKCIFIFLQLLRLRIKILQLKPNTLYSISGYHSVFVLLATYFLKINKYVSDRSSPTIRYSLFVEVLKKILYRRANGVILQTKTAKKIYENRFSLKNISVIPNPVETSISSISSKRDKCIITSGRLVASKRINLLIKIFHDIYVKNSNDWHLIIVGDGPEKKSLVQLSYDLKINHIVHFTGKINNITEILSKCYIFAFTSESEGFPNSLCEAMACGCACISFDCIAGPNEIIINNYNGYLIENNYNIEEYKTKLEYLMHNIDVISTFSVNGINYISKYDSKIIFNQLENTFSNTGSFSN